MERLARARVLGGCGRGVGAVWRIHLAKGRTAQCAFFLRRSWPQRWCCSRYWRGESGAFIGCSRAVKKCPARSRASGWTVIGDALNFATGSGKRNAIAGRQSTRQPGCSHYRRADRCVSWRILRIRGRPSSVSSTPRRLSWELPGPVLSSPPPAAPASAHSSPRTRRWRAGCAAIPPAGSSSRRPRVRPASGCRRVLRPSRRGGRRRRSRC